MKIKVPPHDIWRPAAAEGPPAHPVAREGVGFSGSLQRNYTLAALIAILGQIFGCGTQVNIPYVWYFDVFWLGEIPGLG